MGDQSHRSNTGPERYEHIAAGAAELAQLLMTLHTLMTLNAADMSPLVVENITTLVFDDAAALAPRIDAAAAPVPLTHRSRLPSVFVRDSSQAGILPASPQGKVARNVLHMIDADIAATSSDLRRAISDARQACEDLAKAGGSHPGLLLVIAAALKQISIYSRALGQLVQDRTQLTSALRSTRVMASPGVRDFDGSVTASPRFQDSQGPIMASPGVQDFDGSVTASPRFQDSQGPIMASPGVQDFDGSVTASPRFQDSQGPIMASPGVPDIDGLVTASPRFEDIDRLIGRADRLGNDDLRGGPGFIGP
jgi:hypothetical protein